MSGANRRVGADGDSRPASQAAAPGTAPGRTRMLVSVRSVVEARLAAQAADFIDLKEPRDGALGGLAPTTIRAIVAALRADHDGRIGAAAGVAPARLPVSATIGDRPMHDRAATLERVAEVAAAGVDYVKVGIERDPLAFALLEALAGCGAPIVPVFIADRGIDPDITAFACQLGFPGVMVDTADKRAGSLFDAVPLAALVDFVATVRAAGALAGLAGALRQGDLPRLLSLAPDFAGFRSAVCAGDRSGELDPARLADLARAMRPENERVAA